MAACSARCAHGKDVLRHRPFKNFIIAQFVFRWGLALAMPLLPIYWVKQIGATDPQISAINSAATFVAMIAYFVWTQVSKGKARVSCC